MSLTPEQHKRIEELCYRPYYGSPRRVVSASHKTNWWLAGGLFVLFLLCVLAIAGCIVAVAYLNGWHVHQQHTALQPALTFLSLVGVLFFACAALVAISGSLIEVFE